MKIKEIVKHAREFADKALETYNETAVHKYHHVSSIEILQDSFNIELCNEIGESYVDLHTISFPLNSKEG